MNIEYLANGNLEIINDIYIFLSTFIHSSNALPLIPRGQYFHLSGYNQGHPYNLLDFYQVY